MALYKSVVWSEYSWFHFLPLTKASVKEHVYNQQLQKGLLFENSARVGREGRSSASETVWRYLTVC